MNYYDLISLILTQLHERINSDEFLERFRRPNSFVRYRKLTLKQVVAYLIHSKKRSMDIELSDLQRQLPDGLPPLVAAGIIKAHGLPPGKTKTPESEHKPSWLSSGLWRQALWSHPRYPGETPFCIVYSAREGLPRWCLASPS